MGNGIQFIQAYEYPKISKLKLLIFYCDIAIYNWVVETKITKSYKLFFFNYLDALPIKDLVTPGLDLPSTRYLQKAKVILNNGLELAMVIWPVT